MGSTFFVDSLRLALVLNIKYSFTGRPWKWRGLTREKFVDPMNFPTTSRSFSKHHKNDRPKVHPEARHLRAEQYHD